jgi:8-oxo-dGTP diphosphatase
MMMEKCAWFDIRSLPPLAFDHDEMVKEALHMMRLQLYHYPIGYNLLAEKFTLSEIHALYETMLGKKLDISIFLKNSSAWACCKSLTRTQDRRAPLSLFFSCCLWLKY